jgi:CDP-paratose 2-epimerase
MLEAIAICEELSGKKLNHLYSEDNRSGDHIWYISDVRKFQNHYPEWQYKYNLRDILEDIYNAQTQRF